MDRTLTPLSRGRRLVALAVILLLVAGLALGGFWALRPPPIVSSAERAEPASPFKNVTADAAYVGDKICAGCHAEIAESFAKHPMGRSLAPIESAPPVAERDESSGGFAAGEFRYATERDGEAVIHREEMCAADGRSLDEIDERILFALGSGTRGRSYLFARDGRLFQSPIAWYTQGERWELSPGYAKRNQHFERPIVPICLFCHANRVAPVEGTVNEYAEPIFDGHTIGCERCHGPGSLHAADPGLDGEADYTIVNPRHLDPALRENVCEQCHLQGEQRVLRAGRETFDYRPGLRLADYWSIFVRSTGAGGETKAVGHVEQMHEIRCFRESQGRLGCISCHDPHSLPKPDEKVAYYRSRCVECHTSPECKLPLEQRLARSADDSCIECHMPRLGSDIAHTALTDHRVLVRPAATGDRPGEPLAGEEGLVHFHRRLDEAADPAVSRDLGIAYSAVATESAGGPLSRQAAERAAELLGPAVEADPADLAARESLGTVLAIQGNLDRALAAFDSVLADAPKRETALSAAARLHEQRGEFQAALDLTRRLIEVNPVVSAHHAAAVRLNERLGDWDQAVESARAALSLNPAATETRKTLIACCLRLGDRDQATEQYAILRDAAPSTEHDSLDEWHAQVQRAAGGDP